MNKFIIFLFLVSILITGCKEENNLPEGAGITEYLPKYMFYNVRPPYINTDVIKMVYHKNGTIAKRIGDIMQLSGATGYNGKISDLIYDQVVINNNTITITKQVVPNEEGWYVDPMERVLYFKDGRMVMKIWSNGSTKDTAMYSYNERGLISFIVTRNLERSRKTESKLTYDENRNLTMVASKSYYTELNELTSSDTIRFSGYDHSKNPLTNLIIFDECFYRSLSSNNFTQYSYKKYDSNGQQIASTNLSWTLTYDSDNCPVFSK